MNKFNYYFLKNVLDGDLNEMQDVIEAAIAGVMAKRGIYGVTSGTGYTVAYAGTGYQIELDSGGADPFSGFDKVGLRIKVETNPETFTSPAFTLPTGSNEKWLTYVLRHTYEESQPEVEKKPPVFTVKNFRKADSYELVVLQGTQAGAGLATKPSLAAEDGLYLCDVLILSSTSDFSTVAFVKDDARLTIDALAESVERGADGVDFQYAFLSDIPATEVMGGFSVHKDGAAQSIPTGAWEKVTWPTEDYDILGEFSTVNSRFQPSKAGLYDLNATITMIGLVDIPETTLSIKIMKNGGSREWMGNNQVRRDGFNDPIRTVQAKVEADGVNDYFEVWVLHDDAAARNTAGLSSQIFFQGHQLPNRG